MSDTYESRGDNRSPYQRGASSFFRITKSMYIGLGVGGIPQRSSSLHEEFVYLFHKTIFMVSVYTDGATEGMNGKLGTVTNVGIGIYIPYIDVKHSQRLSGISNNEAEYMALIEGMDICKRNGIARASFFLDSLIVVNGANAPWKQTKNNRMNKFKLQIQERLSYFDEIHFTWIPREENKEADRLSKQSLKHDGMY